MSLATAAVRLQWTMGSPVVWEVGALLWCGCSGSARFLRGSYRPSSGKGRAAIKMLRSLHGEPH